MRYYQVTGDAATGLVAREGDRTSDLGPAGVNTFDDLARRAAERGVGLDAAAETLLDDAERVDVDLEADATLPLLAEEVWAAGVTYQISQEARESESTMPEMYMNVYDAERPEIFFKATPSRTVGPGEAVGIREDSDWDVPEPELGVVIHDGDVVGFTVGNDVSSREIEGENPLYLPQAKVYDRCCAVGPCVASAETVGDPHDLQMSVAIERAGDVVFEDATSTSEMVRTCEELSSYLQRHNVIPETTVLLTGTSLVPPDDFTLHPGDEVSIHVENVGTLTNGVTEV